MTIEDIEFQQACLLQAEKHPFYFFADGRCRFDEKGKPVQYVHDDFGNYSSNPDARHRKLDAVEMREFNDLINARYPGRAEVLAERK